MGNIKYNEPASFEDMEEGQDATPETPKTEPVAQDQGNAVEKTEATE